MNCRDDVNNDYTCICMCKYCYGNHLYLVEKDSVNIDIYDFKYHNVFKYLTFYKSKFEM